jgi:hypothetical protein
VSVISGNLKKASESGLDISSYTIGAIFGHGDIDVYAVLKVICDSGYDGYLSLEFEGMEECKTASRLGMNNVYRILKELNCDRV